MPRGHSAVTLYSGVPLERNGGNQILYDENSGATFSTDIRRYQVAGPFYDLSFIRMDDGRTAIRIPDNANKYVRCNYLLISNDEYSMNDGYSKAHNSNIYGFITDVQYVNDGVTFIYWVQDYFQNWIHFVDFEKCVVERAHVPPNADTIYSCACLPEPVSICGYEYETVFIKHYEYKWHMFASELPPGSPDNFPAGWSISGNFYSACIDITADTLTGIRDIVDIYSKWGMLEAIVAVFPSIDVDDEDVEINVPTIGPTFNGIKIKNAKCFTYPYTSIIISGPGHSETYRFELMKDTGDGKLHFKLKSIVQPNGQIMIWPKGYGNSDDDDIISEFCTAFTGFRQVGYNANVFENSVVQNLPIAAMSIISGAIAGGPAGAGVTLARNIAQNTPNFLVAHRADGNANASNLIFSEDVQISFGIQVPLRENLREIDNYFTSYGYNVTTIQNPLWYYENKGDRKCVFIKTRECEVHGQVPKQALDYIKNLFDKGVRLWTSFDTIGNYD